jgi:hypothetical protein
MKQSLQELECALQILAMPVTFQMRLDVGGACRVGALRRRYDVALRKLDAVTRRQAGVLSELDKALALIRPFPECSDSALRMNESWRRVRGLARVALLAFGWRLRLPPRETPIYQQLKENPINVQQSKLRQTDDLSDSHTWTPGSQVVSLV